jgi:hypothetical protein
MMVGEEPMRLMGDPQQWRMRGPMTDEQVDFRFSASVASRYSNCHGSANLAEAIPGFEHPERNENGMKGEGTRLHSLFEHAMEKTDDLRAKAKLLRDVSSLHWTKYRPLLKDETKYITWWFIQHKTLPPIELSVLAPVILHEKPVLDTDGNPKVVDGLITTVIAGAPPRRIQFIADAIDYVADILDELKDKGADDIEVLIEAKRVADWLVSKPKTTVDLIVRSVKLSIMYVIDLKMGELEVSPQENEQLMYYSKTFGADDYDTVVLVILQRNHIDDWTLVPKVFDKWVNKVLAAEQAIIEGDLTLTPGSHCQFCPANPHGRGDRGNKACPAMMTVLYGERDALEADEQVLEDDIDG